MSYYGRTREEQNAYTEKLAADYRTAAALCVKIKPILASFDGKVYNVRLGREIEKIGRIYTEKRNNRYICVAWCGEKTNEWITLMSAPVETCLDGKRIIAEKMIAQCNKEREKLLREAAELDMYRETIDTYINRLEDLTKQIRRITDDIPYKVRAIYEINYRVTKY